MGLLYQQNGMFSPFEVLEMGLKLKKDVAVAAVAAATVEEDGGESSL